MNFKAFLFLSFFFSTSIYIQAQVQFYIKPLLNVKFQTSSRGFSNNAGHSEYMSNPFFKYTDRNFVFTNSIDLGIAFGVKYNQKHFFEIEYVNETVGKGSVFSHFSVSPKNNWIHQDASYNTHYSLPSKIGLSSHKLGLKYHYNFFTTKNNLLQLRLNFGLGTFFNLKRKDGMYKKMIVLSQSETGSPIGNEGVLFLKGYAVGFSKGINGYFSVGFGFDVNNKRRNILSFDVNYSQGFSSFFQSAARFGIEHDGKYIEYNYLDGSRGSGLTIHISHRLQLYPWIKTKKKEGREIEKF